MQSTGVRYSGRPVFVDKGVYYYLVSKHNTQGNARAAITKGDYPKHKRVTRQGRYFCVVDKMNDEFQKKMYDRTRL